MTGALLWPLAATLVRLPVHRGVRGTRVALKGA
jgi:hypothetical protein